MIEDNPLSNEDKTLEEIVFTKEPTPELVLNEDAQALIAGIMATMDLREVRISDKHSLGKHSVRVKRDIYRRCTVVMLQLDDEERTDESEQSDG